jgi:hypothetical protein
MEPFLDFNFRYQTGLVLSVSLRQFTPGKEPISYLRVIPQGASPVIFRASLELPSVPPDMSGTIDLKDLRKIQFTMSGAFTITSVKSGTRWNFCYSTDRDAAVTRGGI